MRYTVVWHQVALDMLAEIWLASADRRSVTDATAQIDRELAADPEHCGEGFDGRRVHVVGPLWIVFRIDEPYRTVRITKVAYRPPRKY